MERVIDVALWVLLAVLAIAVAFGMWAVFRSVSVGRPEYSIYGLRIAGQSLVGLVIVATLASIRKRLASIEAALTR